jgi:hypothetical protein
MYKRSAVALNGVLVAVMFAIAFWTIYALPCGGQVATHWGPDNAADAWVGSSAIHLVNSIIALVLWFLLLTSPQGFSSSGKSQESIHSRFSGVFLAQLAIQLLLAMHAQG